MQKMEEKKRRFESLAHEGEEECYLPSLVLAQGGKMSPSLRSIQFGWHVLSRFLPPGSNVVL